MQKNINDGKDINIKQLNRIALPVPDPTIDKIDGKQYLILTEYSDEEDPEAEVCFYELSPDNSEMGEFSKYPEHILKSTLMYISKTTSS